MQTVEEAEDEYIEPGAGVFVEFVSAGEDDDSNISVAKDRQFFRLLQQSAPTLREIVESKSVGPRFETLSIHGYNFLRFNSPSPNFDIIGP
ncbi:hypothetical protein SDJN03_14050, partial [Cucurbita argyrosperma subsp. sororia]